MKLLLDTNAIIGLLNGDDRFIARLRQHPPEDIGVPSIVAFELFYGAFKSSRIAENVARIDRLRLEVLDFTREDARNAGDIRAFLAAQGQSIGSYDTLIAGQARARGLILVTHNIREFDRVPGLSIEDWST